MSKVKAFALTHRGMEDIAAEEIQRISGSRADVAAPGVVVFSASYRELCLLCYRSQSLVKVAVLLSEFEAAQKLEAALGSAEKSVKGFDFAGFLGSSSFRVSCMRTGEHDYTSHDLAMALGDFIKDKVKNELDLKKPGCFLFAAVSGSKGFFGIDLAGIDLSKRDYKVFATQSSLKGTVAYALASLAGFRGEGSFLDPFCKDGAIAIEAAALAVNYPLNLFRKESFAFHSLKFLGFDTAKLLSDEDKEIIKSKASIFCADPDMKHVAAAKKNAKIAGINREINFSRMDAEWLDTKFSEHEVGAMASCLNFRKGGDAAKLCREFFYQADYILAEKGKVAIISNRIEELKSAAASRGFTLSHSRKIWSGKQEMEAVVFSRKG